MIVASFYENQANGGNGGIASSLSGGAGGNAEGGALGTGGGSLVSVSNSFFGSNQASAGTGYNGGNQGGPHPGGAGGAATGGAVENEGSMQLSFTTFSDNEVIGGVGGDAYARVLSAAPGATSMGEPSSMTTPSMTVP